MQDTIHKEMDFEKIAAMVKTRIELFSDIPAMVDFLEKMPEYETSLYCHKKMKTDEASSLKVLTELEPILREQNDYRNDALYERLQEYTKEKGYKNGYVLWPIRIAVSGKAMTPCGATEIMELLGKEETLARVQKAISLLQSACS